MVPMASFAQQLQALRHARGLSLRAFATQVNYSHTYLWELETGRKQPSPLVASHLDKALSADGSLSALVPASAPDSPLAGYRRQVEALTRTAPAGLMAQLATWLYDTDVRGRPPLMRLGAERYSRRLREETGLSPFRIEVSRQGRTPTTECRSITTVPAPAEVARRLGLPTGTPVVRREIWYAADDEPVQLAHTFIPLDIASNSILATATTLGAGALYGRLDELGHHLAHLHEQVTTRLPTTEEATALKAPAGVPVLDVLHTSSNSDGRPFEVTRFVIRADVATLDYELAIDD
ncbi:UTRA domain-containing protein [Dactylosporangium sp. NPDC050688]|uniref:UTRA domain-containing protein n=1 Tax=Dactylosporangium sp. NPDC050688 TaxID=3157217 RepID=UPI0033F20F7A